MAALSGHSLRLSRARLLVNDFLPFCSPSQTAVVEQSIALGPLAAARMVAEAKPGWFAILLKAYGLAGVSVSELRLSRLVGLFPRLYQHSASTALITVERELDGEPAVFVYPLRRPETKSLPAIQAELAHARAAPLGEVKTFRRTLLLLRYPRPVRRVLLWLVLRTRGLWRERNFGTFTASNVAPLGALTRALGPHTAFFAPAPVGADGFTTLRLCFDRRVIDETKAVAALAAVAAALHGPILEELRALSRSSRAA